MASGDARRLIRRLRDAMTDNAPPPNAPDIDSTMAVGALDRLREEVVNEERALQGLPPLPPRTPEEWAAIGEANREKMRRENAEFYRRFPNATTVDRLRWKFLGTTPEDPEKTLTDPDPPKGDDDDEPHRDCE